MKLSKFLDNLYDRHLSSWLWQVVIIDHNNGDKEIRNNLLTHDKKAEEIQNAFKEFEDTYNCIIYDIDVTIFQKSAYSHTFPEQEMVININECEYEEPTYTLDQLLAKGYSIRQINDYFKEKERNL